MTEALWALVGVALGATAAILILMLRRRPDRVLPLDLLKQAEKDKADELAKLVTELKTAFAALSREALSANTDDFLKLAKTKLDQQTGEGKQALEEKKKLIDARLEEIGSRLTSLNSLIQAIEKQRAEAHGSLKGQIEKATQVTNRLQDTTGQLREALANPQRRGQWGERMADDVLRLAGFVEGVNYEKQLQTSEGGRPDFTFILPDDLRVHMDVKFPLANYLSAIGTEDQAIRATATTRFLKDVRSRIREVTSRDYIDPSAGTVDFVLVFIPNEQVYGFIHEHDHDLLDDALRSKVVLCSPLTLYAILAIIRQSVDNFRFERASRQILDLLAAFRKQWTRYVETMERMGKRLDDAAKEYGDLVGVRTRQLDRQLDKIDDLQALGTQEADASEIAAAEVGR